MKILLVEDDIKLAEALAEALTDQSYVVDVARDGEKGWLHFQTTTYDLILLDLTLPKLDGISLCRKLRMQGHQVPLLMLTARDTQSDKVDGLDAGADDYVVKPFDLKELLARIRALLRRGQGVSESVLKWQGVCLDPNTYEVTYYGDPLRLTPKEFSLLRLFLGSGKRVLSRSAIVDHLWSFNESPDENTVKAHIKSLRQKLRMAGAPSNFIETIHGIGYRLKQG
ncbi:response regulator transcription factor [Egbenema bharatensis]|uniref:response regulator transcription factor n=1 Tax=Egbenema bharatensis TaxID=3463334 RepID=UPI003A86B7E4